MNNIISKLQITYKTILYLLVIGIIPIMAISILLAWYYDNTQLIRILIIISIIIFFSVLLFTVLLNKKLIQPINDITNGLTKFVSEEDYSPDEIDEEPYNDEVRNLLSSYNQFVQNQKFLNKRKKLLEEQRERVDLAIHGSKIGLWDWNLLNNQCYFSSTWRYILGHTEESIHNLSTEWFTRVHPEDIEKLRKTINDHIAEKTTTFHHEHRIRHLNGTYLWVLARGVVVRNKEELAIRFVGTLEDITPQKKIELRLSAEAMYDTLTGLPNRTYFSGVIDQSLGRIRRREDYHSAVLYIDLDRFKNINDHFSFELGDELLLEVTRRLRYSLRTMDTIARFHEDKFGVLLEEINGLPDMIKITRRLYNELTKPFNFTGEIIKPETSIGVVLLTRGYQDSSEVLRDAESALFQAKANGRGKFEIFDKDSFSYQLSKIRIEKELKHGLKNDEMQIYYQPVVDANNNEILHAQAHLVWNHPDKGIIPNQHYHMIAEESDESIPLNNFALRKSCQEAWDWSVEDFPNVKVSVNIPTKLLLKPDFTDYVLSVLADTNLPNTSLQLVISESNLIYNSGITIQNMFDLSSIGVSFCLADYGVIPSSLEQLNRLPVHSIKISESIIRDVPRNSEDAAITKAIISIGNILGINIIATGVETKEQADFLIEQGINNISGPFISKPLEKSEFINFLKHFS